MAPYLTNQATQFPQQHTQQGAAGAASTADQLLQLRPKRALYGGDRRLRAYDPLDAQAQILLAKASASSSLRGGRGKKPRGGSAATGGGQGQQHHEEFYADYAELGGGNITLISTARLIVMNEEGDTREVFRLADILFVEAVAAGQKPGVREVCVCVGGLGAVATRRMMVFSFQSDD